MLFMICTPPMLGIGLLIAMIGRVRLFHHTAQGIRARLIGLLLMLPFPFGATMLMLFGNGSLPFDWFEAYSFGAEAILYIAVLVVSMFLVLTAPKNKAKDAIFLPDLLTVQEAADYLHVSPQDVEQLVRSGQLAAVRQWNGYRLKRDDLLRFLQ